MVIITGNEIKEVINNCLDSHYEFSINFRKIDDYCFSLYARQVSKKKFECYCMFQDNFNKNKTISAVGNKKKVADWVLFIMNDTINKIKIIDYEVRPL
jgi:hypothetical protein